MPSEQPSQSAPFDLGLFGLLALAFSTLAAMAFFLITVSLGTDFDAQPRSFFCISRHQADYVTPSVELPKYLDGGIAVWMLAIVTALVVERTIAETGARGSISRSSFNSSHTSPQTKNCVRSIQQNITAIPFDPTVFALYFLGFVAVTFAVGATFIAMDGGSFITDLSPTFPTSFDGVYNMLVSHTELGVVLSLEFIAAFFLERNYSKSIHCPAIRVNCARSTITPTCA